MKHFVILNEKAGAIKEREAFKQNLEDSFKGLSYEVYYTEGPRKLIPVVRDYLTKNSEETVRVYACGGDGTIHEVVNAIVGFKNAELAILAVGTGNDFVKIYSEEKDYDNIVTNRTGEKRFQDFSKLIKGEAVSIDLSKISGPSLPEVWYSNNVINFGFDAIVGAKGNINKQKGVKDPYGAAAIIPAILGGRFNNIIVKADGVPMNKDKMLLCSLAQGQWVGGQYHASPKSDNTDGLIDCMLLKCMTLATLMGKYFTPYRKGEHLDMPKLASKIVYKRAKEVEIIAKKDVDICVDGEMIRGKYFKVECIPQAIKFVIPAK